MQSRGSLSSQIGPILRVGSDSMATCRVGRISTSSPLASTGIVHGSPISDDSSQHSDSGMLLKENTSSSVISYPNRSRSPDNALYSQCILAISTMANDPSPRIAKLGKKTLSIISIEQVVPTTEKYSISTHQGKLSAPSAPSSLAGSPSSSWFDMIAGNHFLFLNFFISMFNRCSLGSPFITYISCLCKPLCQRYCWSLVYQLLFLVCC